jgi:hypothetical protein
MLQTAAKIELPDPRAYSRHGMITVTGSVNAVIQARALLVVSTKIMATFPLYRIAFRSGAKNHLSDTEWNVQLSEAERNNISPLR